MGVSTKQGNKAMLHACSAYYTLYTECYTDYCDPDFIADVAAEGLDAQGITLLQLSAEATRLALSDETRLRIANTAPPTTQREINNLVGKIGRAHV